jgi:hypothetical protein
MTSPEDICWNVGPEVDGSDRLIKAFAACGFRVHEQWQYPPYPQPFTVPFSDGTVEITVKFEATEGVLVTGPAKAVQRVQAQYERMKSP